MVIISTTILVKSDSTFPLSYISAGIFFVNASQTCGQQFATAGFFILKFCTRVQTEFYSVTVRHILWKAVDCCKVIDFFLFLYYNEKNDEEGMT